MHRKYYNRFVFYSVVCLICICLLDIPGDLYLIPAAVLLISIYMVWINASREDRYIESRQRRIAIRRMLQENEAKKDAA